MTVDKKGFLKRETEDLIFAVQDQALKTNWIKKNVDGQEIYEKCRLYGERDKSIANENAKHLLKRSTKNVTLVWQELCI